MVDAILDGKIDGKVLDGTGISFCLQVVVKMLQGPTRGVLNVVFILIDNLTDVVLCFLLKTENLVIYDIG